MPHQCVRCGTLYDDTAQELIKGCSKCGGRFFFFIRKECLVEAKPIQLTEQERREVEQDIKEIIGQEEPEKPVILDLESIRVVKPGKYEIDLVKLLKKQPLIYKLEDGKYVIDLSSVMEKENEGD